MKKITLLLSLWLACMAVWAQNRSGDDIKSFTLANGMKILVAEDASIPNANMYLFWKVGSRNEYPGITGLSHFFEHMMFNGAKKYGPKMFDQVMEANGGSNNAYTTEDLTVYTNWFPKDALEVIFDLEADRIGHLNFDDQMIESERGVVISERSTGLENSNFRLLYENVKGMAFMEHPYRWSVIGYESDIKNWTKADLQNYFTTYYAPNNCVIVIAGDVKFDQVQTLAKKYLEPIPAQAPPRAIHTQEPPQNGEKRIMVHKQVSTPNLLIAYHTPEARSDDYYALDVLSALLSDGQSSRLYKRLVDTDQTATSVFTNFGMHFDPNLFSVYAVASAKDADMAVIENAIYEEIQKIAKEGISEKELQKVKNQKLMEFYKSIETINGKANNIGTYEVYLGDYHKLYNAPEAYNKLNIDDIKRVAGKYFSKENRTVGVLRPREEQP
jgi:predicted Zn-dependent peptidase